MLFTCGTLSFNGEISFQKYDGWITHPHHWMGLTLMEKIENEISPDLNVGAPMFNAMWIVKQLFKVK